MTQVLVSLLMILFISGQTNVEGFEITFELIQKIYGWGVKIYSTIDKNPDKSRENIVTIMKQVEEVSSKLDALDTRLDIKLDSMLNTLLSDIKIQGSFILLKSTLRRSLAKINHYFNRIKNYKFGRPFGNDTLKDFAHKALWSANSVPNLQHDLQGVFIPPGSPADGFLSLMLQSTNLNLLHECDTHVSPQQKVYYLYIELIISEMKGFLVQQHCLMLKQLFDDSSHTYVADLNSAKRDVESRLRSYHDLFCSMIDQIPRHMRRCEVHAPERGVHVLEMHKFSRLAFLDPNIVENERCYACPKESILHDESVHTHTTISNCQQMGTLVTLCRADQHSYREFLWWKDEDGNRYGPDLSCPHATKTGGGSLIVPGYRGSPYIYDQCKVCVCTVEMNKVEKDDDSTIWRISTTEQTSDYRNNKVVTGVRFVTHNNALHLQIQQTRFTQSAFNYVNDGWKALDIGYHNGTVNHEKGSMQYVPLRHNRKSIFLDDVSVPSGHVITGVRFQLVDDSAFKLQVLATEFDLGSGDLHQSSSKWLDATTHPTRPDDYKRERTEINMDSADDPTRASEFKYDFESNKLIRFTHTDMNKDGGQTTIPLLEAQPVETNPPFPLSGVGLTFKGRERFGGYVTPRLFTLDVTKYIRNPEIRRVPTTTPAYLETTYKIMIDDEIYSGLENVRYTT